QFKRSLNCKDSGNIFPGHGGMLDRFDAVVGSAPFVYIFIQLLS
ncbi:MAG TPA: phosphatidate cytidylyltransferase, partial [Bacteroidales bacterium]|nr:phosphatidate cytidylyltransferase [Bacteroidales bacterium]